MASELFDEDPAPASNGNGNGGSSKAKPTNSAKAASSAKPKAAAPAVKSASGGLEPLTDPFAEDVISPASESSSEPNGATPLMAAPTSPEVYAAPALPERIAEAVA